MIASANSFKPSSPPDHNAFLALVPRIGLHARISFNGEKCPATGEDKVADCIALAWR